MRNDIKNLLEVTCFNIKEEADLFFYKSGTKQDVALFSLGQLIGSSRSRLKQEWLAANYTKSRSAEDKSEAKLYAEIESLLADIRRATMSMLQDQQSKLEWSQAVDLILMKIVEIYSK